MPASRCNVTNGATQRLAENAAIFIAAGSVHRLANIGSGPLTVIEVQCGKRLDEADIERLDDAYGRS